MNSAQSNERLTSLVLRIAHCLRTYRDNLRTAQNENPDAQTWIMSEIKEKTVLIFVYAITLSAIFVAPRAFWHSWRENRKLFLHHQLFVLGCVVALEIAGTRVVYHGAVDSIENSAYEYLASFGLQLVSLWMFLITLESKWHLV